MAGNIFERVEIKYLVPHDKLEAVFRDMCEHMVVDKYGYTPIMNIYYDTENFDIIRESLDKPVYKEKLRLRSYGVPTADSMVFLELKKKYKGVVYKRRVSMKYKDAISFIKTGEAPFDGQIIREIAYFLKMRKVVPSVVLCYNRVAMYGKDNPEERVTFDDEIRYRFDELDLSLGDHGERLLSGGDVIMEVKLESAMSRWLIEILERYNILPASFSKYGRVYTENFDRLYELYER